VASKILPEKSVVVRALSLSFPTYG
jgi:hypothetical protein